MKDSNLERTSIFPDNEGGPRKVEGRCISILWVALRSRGHRDVSKNYVS